MARVPEPPTRRSVLLLRAALVVGLALVWEATSGLGLVDKFWISSPLLVGAELWRSLLSGALIDNVLYSVYEAFVAFVLASVLGIVTGLMVSRSPLWDEVLAPFVTAVNSMPRVALAPLIILWFGIGITAKVVTAMTLVYFILFVNTAAGAKNVDPDLLTIARLMRASELEMLRLVVLPSALPWIFAGLNLGLTYSLLGVVVAEILSSNRGIGFMIANSAGNFNTTGVFVGLLALVVVASALNGVMRMFERRLFRWKSAGSGG